MNKKQLDDVIVNVSDYVMLANDQLMSYRNKSKLNNYFKNAEGTNKFKSGVVHEKITIAIQSLKRAMQELQKV